MIIQIHKSLFFMPAEIQNTFCIFCLNFVYHDITQGIYNYYNWIIIIITQRNSPKYYKYYLTEECETCFGNQSELNI